MTAERVATVTRATDRDRVGLRARRRDGRRRMPTRQRVRLTFTHVILIVLGLLWIYPFLWMMSSSVKPNGAVFSGLGLIPTKFFFDNYSTVWGEGNVGRLFLNSVIVSVLGVIITVLVTSMMGYALGRKQFPGKRIVIGVLAALVVLPHGYTIIPVVDLIFALHLDGNLFGIILAEVGGAHIIQLLLYAGYFSQLPDSLEESAMLDGAGYFRIFARIYWPLAMPVTATVVILQFIASWNSFLIPLVLTLSKPELQTLAVGLYSFQGENLTNYSQMSAASTISLIPVIVVFLVFQRHFIEGMAGAVKQ
ncbi:carbohydrate ABC transporter permease [Microlunatus soli]|uniref:Raffinose/stachyose/melibiose transport system permease protein n=1 Tax=Microlunatus soli TaxID=630515 RepID=A0A1H1QM25_9ACTN|nr:carbohydrate ABC transporter permease [Microlunatus soli]SDS24455.1 raffinose/stachyose/melibiose transport system permease protein [Microlunatus soli]